MTNPFRIIFYCLAILGIFFTGCNQDKKKEPVDIENDVQVHDTHPVTIVFLGPAKPAHAGLKSILVREFNSLELGTPKFESRSATDFIANPVKGDLVIYPPHVFGDLFKAQLLRSIPEYVVDSDPYQLSDVLRNQRRIFGVHQKNYYATSLGISSYMLLCHRDILDANDLAVPKTWLEYEKVCRQLATLKKNNQLKSVSGTPRFSPAIEPLKESWKAVSLLARAASSIRTSGRYSVCFDYSTWKPLIDSAPFTRALTQQNNIYQMMDGNHRGLDPQEVERAFLNKECVMAISWPHPPSPGEAGSTEPVQGAEINLLPGSRTKYNYSDKTWDNAKVDESQIPFLGAGGLCCSILKSSTQSGVATRRLAMISGKELSGLIGKSSPLTGFPYRASHLARTDGWISPRYPARFSESFSNTVKQQNQAKVWMCRPRHQKSSEYESLLAREIQGFLEGKLAAQQALTNVSQNWEKLGNTVDLQFQKQLNLETLGAK